MDLIRKSNRIKAISVHFFILNNIITNNIQELLPNANKKTFFKHCIHFLISSYNP